MFINPMWQDEVQRIGTQRCTPVGYQLHGVSDLIGFIAILLLLAVPCYLGYAAVRGGFSWSLLWLLLLPIAVAIVGNVIHAYSWRLAELREFHYDYETRVSTWRTPSGAVETFTYADWRREFGQSSESSSE